MPAWWWSADTGLAVLFLVLEAGALFLYWLYLGIKLWAGERPGGGAAGRLVVTIGPACLALVSWGSFRLGLPVTGVSQAVAAVVLSGYLGLLLVDRFCRRVRLRRASNVQ